MSNDGVRVDKWLWAVRIFKTRSLAADACKKSKVLVDGEAVKPSKTISVGAIVDVKKPPVIYTYKVLELVEKRMGAKLVSDYLQDLTPETELDKLQMMRHSIDGFRKRGTGRPTKKERRDLDDLKENS
ncbi:MAG: RNA-binding S4 domain-containing protein [Salinivirgaceae bacterium]|jgi:ribosome-associated heat shock protein Hsp15|nr:RNA-binding S4 domain-containing protein [Salinivirgaceae bacterium]